MEVKLNQIKLANPVKLGRHEELVFRHDNDFRSHGTKIELVAIQMPVENVPGKFLTQPVVKLTDNLSREVSYTSLANTIYFKADLGVEAENEVNKKRARSIKI